MMTAFRKFIAAAALLAAAGAAIADAAVGYPDTPAAAVERLAAGNARFSAGEALERDHLAEVKATAGGQTPFAAIISCLDSRVVTPLPSEQARPSGPEPVGLSLLGVPEIGQTHGPWRQPPGTGRSSGNAS